MTDILQWQYSQKLISAEEAVKKVKSGDHIFYGEFALFPETLDEELAKRINELDDFVLTGVSYTKPPKVVLADP